MKNFIMIMVLLLFSVTLASCSLLDKKTESTIDFKSELLNSDEPVVYIARNEFFFGSYSSYKIEIDGEVIGKLKMNAYIFKQLKPGNHTLNIYVYGNPTHKIDFEINSGKAMLLILNGSIYKCGYFDKNKIPSGFSKYKLDFGN